MKLKLNPSTWIFIIVGGLFILVGLVIGLIVPQGLSQAAARVEQLPISSAATLEQQAANTEVIMEGQVSSSNPILSQSFVAYKTQMYKGTDDNDYAKWEDFDTATPAIQFDSANTRIQIVNQDYILDGNLKTWQESEVLSYSSMRNTGTLRRNGLEYGDNIMVLGTTQPTAEGMGIDAEIVYAGNQSSYIATHRNVAFWMRWAGVAVAGAGLIMLGIVLYLARK